MKSMEMMRCQVRSPGGSDSSSPASVRYVPSEIFRLWQYLMVNVKGFGLTDQVVGQWMDEEMYSRDRPSPGGEADPVVEVAFVYTRDTDLGRPVIRYFPQDSLDAIMGVFLKHFSREHIQGHARRTLGYFVPKPSKD